MTENLLSDTWVAFLAWLEEQPGVTDVNDLGTPDPYIAGCKIDGIAVSITVSYTQ